MTNKTEINYPILVFSDLHWGMKPKLQKIALETIKTIADKYQVRSLVSAGDMINIDLSEEIINSNNPAAQLTEELIQIRKLLGNLQIYIIAGNHDTNKLYSQEKLDYESLDIQYLGTCYKDDYSFITHGDEFWNNFNPPLTGEIDILRKNNQIKDQIIILGHKHKIFDEPTLKFYCNGSIGKGFSVVIHSETTTNLLPTPLEVPMDLEKLITTYEDFSNAEELIDNYVDKNFHLINVEGTIKDIMNKYDINEKTTWFVEEDKQVLGHISGQTLLKYKQNVDLEILQSLQIREFYSSNAYQFQLGQRLKEAWAIFSATGEFILPVLDDQRTLIGKLSIFSVPKSEKKHQDTQNVELDDQMSNLGDSLIERMMRKSKEE
ncbi:MAG: metallophosphoesterase family protein [Candidatus Heimdallarchaeota archaeon]|nr:metallophosphoesterase family protein [Candidatus Heimdallarchaeota archaeon]MDH5645102.1 metallophosphoesterase family protein [Candidatus Heimdallarchaeota archaeon]